MKNKLSITIIVLEMLLVRLGAEESQEQIVKRLTELGEGVHEVKTEGVKLKSLMVVGQDRISTVLGEAKGLQTAQKRATLKANAAFVDWMKMHVTSVSAVGDETIIAVAGDGQSVSEQGKASETTRQQIVTMAEGLVRGMTLVAKDQNPDTKMMTLIFSWSPAKSALANEAKSANNKPSSVVPSAPAPDTKDISRKTVISPDFDK